MYKPIDVDQVIAKLPPGRRAKIEARARKMAREEMTLRKLRVAMAKTQTHVAKKLHTNQAAVSKLEQRNDMLLSTLRSYIEAIGGSLELTAKLPGVPPVAITRLADIEPVKRKRTRG